MGNTLPGWILEWIIIYAENQKTFRIHKQLLSPSQCNGIQMIQPHKENTMGSGTYICNIKRESGTCGTLPMCLLSTRNALLGQTSGPASPVCLSAWQKGWCLGRGGSLASPPASPTIHSHCFGDVRSLPRHLWTCHPWACPNPFEPTGSACLPSLTGQWVPGVHHLLCKEIISFTSYKSIS